MFKFTFIAIFIIFYSFRLTKCQEATSIPQDECTFELVQALFSSECIDDNEWILTIEDNFNKNELNNNIWNTTFYWMDGHRHTYYTDGNNYEFDNGILRLIMRREPIAANKISYLPGNLILEDGDPNFRQFEFTSGMIFSHQTFDKFIAEIRCKIPSGNEFWPAFWFYGKGEIDVFEFFHSNQNKIAMAIHNFDGWTTEDHRRCKWEYNSATNYSNQFHTYAVYYDLYEIIWFVDGQEMNRFRKYRDLQDRPLDCRHINYLDAIKKCQAAPHGPMHLIVSTSPHNSDPYPMPNYMDIDFVRLWQPIGECDDKTIINIKPDNDNIYGNTITFDEQNVISSGDHKKIIANTEIIIKDNFIAEKGSNILFKVNNKLCNKNYLNSKNLKSTSVISNKKSYLDDYIMAINSTEKNTVDTNQIIDDKHPNYIKVYPNPTNNRITIESDGSYIKSIFITTLTGNIVYKKLKIKKNVFIYDFQNQNKGVYILKIIKPKTIITKKIILL